MAKQKKSNLQQIDILSALKDKELFVEDKVEETNEEKKSYTPFDFVNDIRKSKKGDMLDKEQYISSFDSFMVIKALSMKENDVYILNMVNKFIGTIDKKTMYNLLVNVIPKDYSFYKWIKSKNEDKKDNIDAIVSYFKCSKKEANEYLHVMGESWGNQIKKKFGDFTI